MLVRLVAAGALVLGLAAAPGARVGIEMPAAGDDGGAGLAATAAIRLGLGAARTVARDSAGGGVQNPHQDEGSDNDVDRRLAPRIVASFAADPGLVAAVGGLRRAVGDLDAAAAGPAGLPMIVLGRWSRDPGRPNTFCLCASPPRLAAFARSTARARFGPRLLLVLAGEATVLPARWPGRLPAAVAVDDGATSVATARARARDADAVLLLAGERPPLLWRATVFARRFELGYLRGLGRRGSDLLPAGTAAGEVLALGSVLPRGAGWRRFAQRYHAAAGFLPDETAARGYAAGQILAGAGTSRDAVRAALSRRRFATAAGPVAFDRDGFWAAPALAASPP